MTAPAELQLVDVEGEGLAAGRAYGEACRDRIAEHLEGVLARLSGVHGVALARAHEHALRYRAATARAHPELAAEVDGVAQGANLTPPAGWVLQLRAELSQGVGAAPECTSLAVTGSASAAGGTLAGQNLDLPPSYRDLLVLLRRRPLDGPPLLTVTPAGQIGQHGLNATGVAVFANFLVCDGWRVGVPRYLLSRLALAARTRQAAMLAVERTRRGSPRNLLVADPHGVVDVEATPTASARLHPRDGRLAHTNHFLSRLRGHERADADWLRNSRHRLARVNALLADAEQPLGVDDLARILRDREGAPDAVCHVPGEGREELSTVASTIAETAERRLWVAVGAPHSAPYRPYDVS